MSTKTKRARVLRITMTTMCHDSSTPIAAIAPRKLSTPEPVQIVELLEHILLYLPMRDLLLAQRICKRWHSIITHSKALQRALHFLPVPTPRFSPSTFAEPNALLASAFKAYFYFPTAHSRIWLPYSNYIKGSSIQIVLMSTEKKWEQRFRRPEASWRRMLVTQPPVNNVIVVDERIAPDYEDCFAEWAQSAEGVRMGELLQLEEEERLDD